MLLVFSNKFLYSESIVAVKEWLKSLPISELTPVECGSDTLNSSHIEDIEKAVGSFKVWCIVLYVLVTLGFLDCTMWEMYSKGEVQSITDLQSE